MTLGSEFSSIQYPLVNYATQVGWKYLKPEDAFQLRGGEEGLLLQEPFLSQGQLLNPEIVNQSRAEDLAKRLTHVLPRIEGNLEAWQYLRGLKTVFVPEEKRERNVKLLADRWEENVYQVTSELRFYNGAHHIRIDVAFFINGIPVLMVETKSAMKIEGIAEALDQVRRYHREGPELLALMQLYTLTHQIQYYYGPTWNTSHKLLFNWRDENADPDFETLVKSFLHPQRITRLLTDFILFTRTDDELNKVILRPHQMRAVERLVRRAAERKKHRALIWHTQGSGKTYTMITTAKRIIEEPLFENPTVLMLVDRNELEAQLFGNLASIGFEHVEVAQSKHHLHQLLASDRRGLIVSMIHKFDDIPDNINPRDNIFVLVDEAHRTTGGNLGNYLMAALPNATYLGFTGTPIDKTVYGKGTFIVFGRDDPNGYLDKYSIAESIHDRTTVPLHYALAPSDLRVDRETLDKEFLALVDAEGVSDIDELNHILDKAVTLRNMLKNRDRMQRVAAHVADDFIHKVEPMGYKAFLVAVDREACALYKDLLDQYLPPEYSAVVYSPAHNDTADLARYHLSDEREQAVRKSFRKPGELPKILIVTEKLLTGYDAPILYCMYLDKPMRDHVLLQAIARVNRPYEDEYGRAKTAGFILDYVGVFEYLEKALAFDSQDVADIQKVVTELDVLKAQFEVQMQRARESYLPITEGYSADKATEKVLIKFRDEQERQAFYKFYREISDLYEILSPDAFLYIYIDDYDLLTRMYKILRAAYDSVFVDSELTSKTAHLVQEHTHGSNIQDTLKVYEINENLLVELAKDDTSDTVKIFNLLKSIQEMIAKHAAQAPYLLEIGTRAEAIVQAYQLQLKATQDALEALEDVVREINLAEHERNEMNLRPESFAIYWLLNRDAVPNAEWIAREMEDCIKRYPHWRTSAAQEREIRRALTGVLLKEWGKKKPEGMKEIDTLEIVEMVEKIMKIAGRAGEVA
jgi:type I restriction enzyme R subunit